MGGGQGKLAAEEACSEPESVEVAVDAWAPAEKMPASTVTLEMCKDAVMVVASVRSRPGEGGALTCAAVKCGSCTAKAGDATGTSPGCTESESEEGTAERGAGVR